ncbi:sensor histidine kinase [Rathayibacter soli]|uniref:sensor histidine kinase n=1 Tax=Rathayibacter soli TaxID=3144168 RepID=UPI0027E50C3C|nr:sensor histidine kinase [Glaciibacter superstes]
MTHDEAHTQLNDQACDRTGAALQGESTSAVIDMHSTKWWDLAFGLSLPLLALMALISYSPTAAAHWGANIVLGVVGACYLAFGRRALSAPPLALPFVLVLIAACALAAAFTPSLATLQAIAIPYLWCIIDDTRQAIAYNIVLIVAVAVGFAFGFGFSIDAVTQAVMMQGLSLLFSLALGLWITHIVSDSARRGHLLQELRSVQSELAAANHEAGVASERERIAREIHDTIAQSLTSLVMLAQRARGELPLALGPAVTRALESIDLIETTARDALTEARSLVAALAPVTVGDSSLAEVMTRLANRFDRETGVRVSASVTASAVPRELEVVLLRCAQEGLANVRKHAQASEARVCVSQDGAAVQLTVQDNGCGIADYSPASETGFGLGGMRDRVALVGGSLDVSGTAGTGTTLRVTIPMTVELAA